ncbi:MAG: ABC transporter ATP-binding protein [Lachnospiraceae bacterium]|nr:ABC transporter ATP-binding protein [Lachnospiraceae bacterium]MBP5415352.1 ABC transporter ATP-binding protein [Lachnospiraceae bacterium]
MKNAISVRDLKKSYKEHEAVKGISFDVNEGEFFAFLGENGAGKSTTINMLCTILSKTSGDVRIFDHELGREDDSIRKLIGIVFQNSVLDNKLTVKENLLTRGAYYGLNKKQVLERMEPFMESFELNEIWNRRYERLSGGQRRRVDIMRALIHDPRILFLDEPTTGLDPKSRMLVWEHIRRLKNEKNLTIFLTTHYMEETADADNVVILDKGRIIANGTPSKLKTDYASSHLVWYVNKDERAEEVIKGYDWKYDSDHYSVDFKGQITDLLYRNRDLIRDFEIKKGSMDDVFLNLTGKEFAG